VISSSTCSWISNFVDLGTTFKKVYSLCQV